MKKFKWISIIVLTAMLAGVFAWPPIEKAAAYYTSVVASEQATVYGAWQVVGTFASSGGAATDLAVGERTYLTILAAIAADSSNDGQIVVYSVPFGANAMRFRNIGLAAAGDHVYQVYTGAKGGASDCAFVKRGTLTFKTGSQASTTASYEYADLLTVSNTSASSSAWTVANPGDGSELVAEAFIDLQGDDMIVIVPTTLDDNSKLLGKFY